MWQSPKWTAATANVLTPEETRHGVGEDWLSSVRIAWRLYKLRKSFDVVSTVGHRIGVVYGLLSRLTPGEQPAHVVREIFFEEVDAPNWQWKLKRSLLHFAFAKAVAFIVTASAEARIYAQKLSLPPERFHFVPFHTNIPEPHREPGAKYGFAAGRSLRDYKTFFESVRGLEYPFVVVADKASVASLDVPPNVKLHCDIPHDVYVSLLRDAAFVVVPLRKTSRSTGQVVILEAFGLGKPVVATRTMGTDDYVDSETGLLYEPYNAADMRAQIHTLISDPARVERMGRAGLERVLAKYTFDHYVDSLLQVLSEAAQSPHD